jgi:RNA polymerase sigma-70 factor (ECF subfamily)
MVNGRPQSGPQFGRSVSERITGIYFAAAVRNRGAKRSPVGMSTVEELGRFRPQLLSIALRRLRNRDQAEDAVQETLLAALEGIERFGGASSLGTWLVGILKHKIADALRASGKEEPLEYDDCTMDAPDPAHGLARRRVLEALERGLKQLPGCAARAFVLREVMGMDTAEICTELEISSSNCWVMVHRVRSRLRACPSLRGLAADAI